jgi:hypothetical protein
MGTWTPGLASNITEPPTLLYDSDNGVDEITLDLSTSPANADGSYIYRIPYDYSSGPLLPLEWRSAKGTFTITGLSQGVHYFLAVPHDDEGKVGPASKRVRVFLGTIQGLDTLLATFETQLRNLIWNTNPIFGDVQVTSDDPDEVAATFSRKPVALIVLEDVTPSPTGGGQYPELVRAHISVHIYQKHGSMDRGRAVLMGGNITDEDKSEGKGILEIRRKVRAEVAKITTANGTRYVYYDDGTGRPQKVTTQSHTVKTVLSYLAEVYDAE